MPDTQKTAIVLFNLGGPDSLRAVRPFLTNLFSDPAILRLPGGVRQLAAFVIAGLRTAKAKHIYARMGGRSPIAEQSWAQASALQERLKKDGDVQVFVCMRYWHPFTKQVVKEVKHYQPDRVILLPLYPQYSTASTASSLKAWAEEAFRASLDVPTTTVCCYPAEHRFIAAHVEHLRQAYFDASKNGPVRVLFSAHGLPEKIVDDGDPYPWQVDQTVRAIVGVLAIDDLDYSVCYQSRVGPLKWLAPYTEEEIRRAGAEGLNVVIVPVSFVGEHSETLVELDIDYAALARESGVKDYARVPALGVSTHFIEGLAGLCRKAMQAEPGTISSNTGERICPRSYGKCPCMGDPDD